jgi:hypothetical protein
MTYREPAPREPPPTFSMHPFPRTLAILLTSFGLPFFLLGAALVIAALVARIQGTPYTDPPLGAIGAFPFGIGGLLVALGLRGLLTKVRFTLEDERVTIDWLRFGRRFRRELVAKKDLVDVGLDSAPSSGASVYSICVGTRAGDIPLESAKTSGKRSYDEQLRALAAFLAVPVRPS